MKTFKNIIITFILILSTLELPVLFLQVMAISKNSLGSLQSITGTFGSHHSMLANMMTFPLGFSLFKLLEKPKSKSSFWFAALALASLYSIIFSGSRSNLIGLGVAILFIGFLKIRFKPVHLLYLFAFLLGLFLLIRFSPIHHLINGTIHSSDTGSLDLSSLGRIFIWKNCWNYYLNATLVQKLFGVGMANLMTIPFPIFILPSKFAGGAHNIFLHVLIETGFIGFVIFMSFYISVLIKLYRQSTYDKTAMAYFFITLSLLLSGFTQEIFWFQPVFGCLWLYHTCLLALILDNKNGKTGLDTAGEKARFFAKL